MNMFVKSLMYSPARYYALLNMNLRCFWLKHIKSDLVYSNYLKSTAYGGFLKSWMKMYDSFK